MPINAGSVCLEPAPLFHAHGLGQTMIATGLGCTVVLPRRFDAEETLALIERHRVQVLTVVPTMLQRIMDLDPAERAQYDTGSLRVVVCSGSALAGGLANDFMDEFGDGALQPLRLDRGGVGHDRDAARPARSARHGRQAACPTRGSRSSTRTGARCHQAETGHIFVGHEMLFEGYTDPSQSRRVVDGMMTPGDLGHVDEAGRLFIDSREDDMIISGGENVYPGQVEEVLRGHPDVEDAVVIGVEDERFGQRLVAYVVPRPGSGLTPRT